MGETIGVRTHRVDSTARLTVDLVTARVLVWLALVGRDADLTPESHLYFFDRYGRLAECHRRLGHTDRARRLKQKAAQHYRLAGGDGPPYAAALAMPPPRQWVVVDARGRQRHNGPDAA